MPKTFKHPKKTAVPSFLEDWEDLSWHQDGCGSCFKAMPSKAHPKARLVAWVDDEDHDPDVPRFILEWWPNEFVPAKPATLFLGNDIKEFEQAVRRAL